MIYIGNFLVLTNQQEIQESDRRHGEFNLIVESPRPENALRLFRDRIVSYRKTSEFFSGDCSIFLIQLLEFDGLPNSHAMMVTYKSTVGDPALPYIGCLLPNEQAESCRIYDWQNNRPEIDGENEAVFLSFKELPDTDKPQ